jgi:hypothetical protein
MGASVPDHALVASDQAAARLAPSGFDPSRYCDQCGTLIPLSARRKIKLLEAALEKVFGVTDLYMDIFGSECLANLAKAKAIAMEARQGPDPQGLDGEAAKAWAEGIAQNGSGGVK